MTASKDLISYLKTRRSVTLPFLSAPGPTDDELAEMLTIATRVPDHGKLAPWRLVVYSGDNRAEIGERLAKIVAANDPLADAARLEVERKQFLPAPLTIGVISAPVDHPKIPEFEQLLSAGCVALNLVHAANAFGYGAHWITRWFCYDAEAAKMLGAKAGERFVGFVHIGTAQTKLEERERPLLDQIVTQWGG